MNKPIAVLISDCHYSLKTYEVADQAFRMAIDKAAELKVPLVDCGDLTNDKSIIRAEYMNVLLDTFNYAKERDIEILAIVGNHSLLNEKGSENALRFLEDKCVLVSQESEVDWSESPLKFYLIPYQSKSEDFMAAIRKIPKGSIVIGHQGTLGGPMGDYVKDPSAVNPEDLKDWRVFLGHYHAHFTIGTVTSVGNPYTLSFGEAKDPAKGFLVLHEDGSFERVLTNRRKHVIIDCSVEELKYQFSWNSDDLIWLKVRGSRSQLDALDKKEMGLTKFGTENYKLEKIYSESIQLEPKKLYIANNFDLFDHIISIQNESEEYKEYLKTTWKGLFHA